MVMFIGQQISHFDRCQLTITWLSYIKDVCDKPRLHVWSMAALLHNVIAAIIVKHACPGAILLAIIPQEKHFTGFHEYGAPLGHFG